MIRKEYKKIGSVPLSLFLLAMLLFAPALAEAAIGTGGATCTAQSKTAGTSLACTVATQNLDAGNVAVLWFAGDNTATADGNDGLLSSVTDSAGNTWTVRRCFTNAQGGSGNGATTCIATSKLSATLTSGIGTITANFASTTAKAIVVKEFTVGAGNNIAVAGTPQDLANDNSDPGSMTIAGLANAEHLFVRSTALERTGGGTWTPTASYTTSGCGGTSGGGSAGNMESCGEFRILTATTDSSNPTGTAVDNASVFIAFDEVVAGAPTQLAFLQQPTNTAAGSTITPAITVEIQDAGGNLVTTATNTVTIAFGTDPSGGTAVLSGTLSVAAVAGVATFSDLSIDTGGTGYTLTASAAGLTGATSNSFNITVPAGTFGATECAASRFGSDLVCTAQDVSITGIAVAPGGPTSCVGGQSVTITLDINVNFATPNRWDAGLFLSSDGKTPELLPASGGASSCTVAVLDTPTINPATSFLDLDPGPWGGTTDACGDGNSSISGGTGSGVQRVTGVPVACQAVDLSGGRLFIPFLTSWDNQSSPSGSTCTSNLNPVPNTKSKCNVPDGTVLADVLKSTVELVVLPDISKTDGIATVTAGDSTTYTVVITNTTGATLNNAIFQDPAVTNLTIDTLGCAAAGGATCPASYPISAMQGGGITIPAMPANSNVTFTIGATVSASTPAGIITNTAYVTVSGESNSAFDTDNVIAKLAASKSFVPASIGIGGTSVLTVTIENSNLSAATGLAFTDNYPAGLVNTAVPNLTNTCGGTATASAGGSSLSISGGTISAGGSCTVTVDVTSAAGGAYNNSTGNITSNEYTGDPATATLAVATSSLANSTKSWQDINGGEADPGDTIRYTITVIESAGYNAIGVSVSDVVPAGLTGISIVSCPAGATCNVVGQTVTATGVSVTANGSVTLVFDATIGLGASPGDIINNCATITNPGGVGASPCASTIVVSPSAVAGTGNKRLYLNATSLSRVIPASSSTVTITKSSSQVWSLSPVLQMPVTISPDVTPLAIIPVNLYLSTNTASESRTVQVDVTCSGGGTTYSETKIFDGTAVNNPYLSTTATLVSFTNLTISADHTCAAGQTWDLTVRNNTTGNGTRNVIVSPVSGVNNSYISLPSLSIINVDSVNSYNDTYPAVTTPPSGYYTAGNIVYVRAVVSDPFGSFDITSATVTIKDPDDNAVVTNAVMTQVADSGASTKTYEYSYVVPVSGPSGFWTPTVTAKEGAETTVSDSGSGTFSVVLMPSIQVAKFVVAYSDPINGTTSPKAVPGSVMTYTVLVTNSGYGTVDNNTTVITDPIPANTEFYVNDIGGAGSGPLLFVDGTPASGLSYSFISLGSGADNISFSNNSGATYVYTPVSDANGCDTNITNIKISPAGVFNGVGGGNPSFSLIYRVRVK